MKAWDRDVYDQYFVRFHDDPGPSQVMLAEEFYTTDVDGVPGSWCLQSHVREGIFRDADMSRDDDLISRRADEPRSGRRSRAQDEEGRQYV